MDIGRLPLPLEGPDAMAGSTYEFARLLRFCKASGELGNPCAIRRAMLADTRERGCVACESTMHARTGAETALNMTLDTHFFDGRAETV